MVPLYSHAAKVSNITNADATAVLCVAGGGVYIVPAVGNDGDLRTAAIVSSCESGYADASDSGDPSVVCGSETHSLSRSRTTGMSGMVLPNACAACRCCSLDVERRRIWRRVITEVRELLTLLAMNVRFRVSRLLNLGLMS